MRFLRRYYFVLHLSSRLTSSRKRGLTIMPFSELWPMMYWIIDPSDKCHRFPFISLAFGSAKRWCNFSVMEQCDKFTLKTCHPRRKKPALKEPENYRNNWDIFSLSFSSVINVINLYRSVFDKREKKPGLTLT